MRVIEQPLATPALPPRLGRRPEGMLEPTLVKSLEIWKLLQRHLHVEAGRVDSSTYGCEGVAPVKSDFASKFLPLFLPSSRNRDENPNRCNSDRASNP